jgi:Na+-driven multidrug efflux pump
MSDLGGDAGKTAFSDKSDAAFLFVLFTFQFFVACYGTIVFFQKLLGSKEYQKEKKVTAPKLTIQFVLIVLNLFWMWNTSKLIAIDTEMQDQSFNPFDTLGLS